MRWVVGNDVATRKLKDGRRLELRLASYTDTEAISQAHPLPRRPDLPEKPYRAYCRGKAWLYVKTPGAGIVTGWVGERLVGFVFFCRSISRLKRTAKSLSTLGWLLKHVLLGHLGWSPFLWVSYLLWVLQHFRPPNQYRTANAVTPEKDLATIEAWIGTVHTVAEFRRLSVASACLAVAEELLTQQGASEVALWAAVHNEAVVEMYQELGYTAAAQVEKIGEECFLMTKDLTLVNATSNEA